MLNAVGVLEREKLLLDSIFRKMIMSDLSSQPTPIQTIYNWYRSGSLIVNRNYQRKLVWTQLEKQKLIDSILRAYPIPLVLLAELRGEGASKYEILDGLQRLYTIVSFIEHGFSTLDGKYFNVDEFTRAKQEREEGRFVEKEKENLISRSDVAKILDYILPVSVIRNAGEDVVTDVFSRINSYGHRLSEQERRQAGLLTELAQFVRLTACDIRGDVSVDSVPLFEMPQISIDLPKSNHGYTVHAENVFWVEQGILRSTDLRDSLDEQVIADLVACIVSSDLVERSKETLDSIYDPNHPDGMSVSSALAAYGTSKLAGEIKYCINLCEKIVEAGESRSLRSLIFETRTTNAFPTVFSTIFLAIHELSFKEGMVLADSAKANASLKNVHSRLNTRRDALGPDERRNNINTIKGRIRDCFVPGKVADLAYGPRNEMDVRNTILRSKIELSCFELKQGVLRLDGLRAIDENVFAKVLQTVCGIANVGPKANGSIFIGVADKASDAERIKLLDGIDPVEISGRWVVGIDREIKIMNTTPEKYFQMWREKISKSDLSEPLRSDVLAHLDLRSHKGMSILVIAVPSQKAPSFLNAKAYIREADQTVEAAPTQIVGIAGRFLST